MTDLHETFLSFQETEAADILALDVARYRPQIEAALVYADATHAYDDVARMIAAGELQLWPGPASCIVTELVRHPRKTLCNIFLAGGNLRELRAMAPILYDWARAQGAEYMTFTGRPGWVRTFLTRDDGWSAPLSYYVKPL